MNDPDERNIRDNKELSTARPAAGKTSEVPAESTIESTMKCPACRAKQVWSPECRRCAADLTLLLRFEESFRHQRSLALAALQADRQAAAIRHAYRLCQLRSDEDSMRLLAVCQFVAGNYNQAAQIACTL